MPRIKVEYFGPAKKFTDGKSGDVVDFARDSKHSLTLQLVLSKLSDLYGIKFGEFIAESCGIALNEEYLTVDRGVPLGELGSNIEIADGDEIVLIPPVSSG
ncbi:DEKNAAC101993 [Brettanomyces naardenensis]|uniref:DEKNAAC101993 n=1 Tax=Brettanomyces naardenensis TaxID=13370 RepID=A0A448YJA0_BRENA|nr:DEKNAAC101993 [Brettanomyces naardenensis]